MPPENCTEGREHERVNLLVGAMRLLKDRPAFRKPESVMLYDGILVAEFYDGPAREICPDWPFPPRVPPPPVWVRLPIVEDGPA